MRIIIVLTIVLFTSCSKGGSCDCVNTRHENYIEVEKTSTHYEDVEERDCLQRNNRGSDYVKDGVYIINQQHCTYSE